MVSSPVGGGRLHPGLQGQQAARDVFQCDRLQFRAPLQGLRKHGQAGFDRLAALRKAVEEAGTVEVTQAGDPRGVGLGLQIAPLRELGQRGIDLLQTRRLAGPLGASEHFVGAQLQAVLPLGGGEHVHHGPVERRLLGADMAEQIRRIDRCRHATPS